MLHIALATLILPEFMFDILLSSQGRCLALIQSASDVQEQGAVDDRDTFLHGVRDLLSIHSSNDSTGFSFNNQFYPFKYQPHFLFELISIIQFVAYTCYHSFRCSSWIINICISTRNCSADIWPSFRLDDPSV